MKEKRGLLYVGIDAKTITDFDVIGRHTGEVYKALDDGYAVNFDEDVVFPTGGACGEVCTVLINVSTPLETLLLTLSRIVEDIKGRYPELYQIDVSNKERMRKFSEMIESNGFSPSDVYMWLQIPSEDEKDCLF